MKTNIDETELARLEKLKEDSDNNRKVYGGDTLATVWYHIEAANAVPELVAEVRRLREALNKEHRAWQCAEGRGDGLEMENAALREKVEAWAWWDEVAELNEDQFWCSFLSRCAANEMCDTYLAAREAVHADRE